MRDISRKVAFALGDGTERSIEKSAQLVSAAVLVHAAKGVAPAFPNIAHGSNGVPHAPPRCLAMAADLNDFLVDYDLTDEQRSLASRLKAEANLKQLLNALADHALFFGREASLQRRPVRLAIVGVGKKKQQQPQPRPVGGGVGVSWGGQSHRMSDVGPSMMRVGEL